MDYLWIWIIFFNGLWNFFIWILFNFYGGITRVFSLVIKYVSQLKVKETKKKEGNIQEDQDHVQLKKEKTHVHHQTLQEENIKIMKKKEGAIILGDKKKYMKNK